MATSGCSTHGKYQRGCTNCSAVLRVYNTNRRAAIANGQWEVAQPAHTVRDHITKLRDAGMRTRDIAAATKVTEQTINRIGSGRSRWVQGPTARAILNAAYTPPRQGPRADRVPATATIRQLRALVANGHTLTDIGKHLNRPMEQIWAWTWGSFDTVSEATARTVAALYDRLSTTSGRSQRAYSLARRQGWAPPLAWDDDTIGDPNAQPDLGDTSAAVDYVDWVLVERFLACKAPLSALNQAERAEAWLTHARRGGGVNEFARAHGMSSSTARAIRDRAEGSREVAA